MRKFILLLSLTAYTLSTQGQTINEDSLFIKKIYDQTLTQAQCYHWLEFLTTKIGGRLAGSPQAAAAVEYGRQMLDTLHLDSVWLQPCMVPHWVRGEKEKARIVGSKKLGDVDLHVVALGNSVGTGADGIAAEVVEVQSLDEVDKLGRAGVAGKIVFYDRPFDPTLINTFEAYGGAVDQRGGGASRAAKYGAVGVMVRSMSSREDDVPHTGSLHYQDGIPPIPAIAISTNDADLLKQLLKEEPVRVYMRTNCQKYPDEPSYNVIGEIRGSEKPEEIILVGGHLDSWDTGQGAHDDGTGIVQSMEVLRQLKQLNYKPKRTIRCVLFMNEENGLAGGRAYAEISNKNKEFHLAAIESDRGGFTPRGFSVGGTPPEFEQKFKKLMQWTPLLEPYGIHFERGGGGADISPLESQHGLLMELVPDSQRYFVYHHTAIDRFEAVNKRELELGAASMTAFVYLLDKYGTN